MRRLLLCSLLLLAPATGQGSEPSSRLGFARNAARAHDPANVLVKLAPGHDADRVLRGLTARRLHDSWYLARVPSGLDAPRFLAELALLDGVELAELDYLIQLPPILSSQTARSPQLSPNDPLFDLQSWNMGMVQAIESWSIAQGEGATLAVIDTGGSSLVPDLACHEFVHPYNAIEDISGPGAAEDDNGHGSHVAGTALQCTDNGIATAGVAAAAAYMPIKSLDDEGFGSFSDLAVAIHWAIDHGADVINLSLGANCFGQSWPGCSESMVNEALDRAREHDVLVVVAAGNHSDTVLSTPGNHPDVLSVVALDQFQEVPPYSNVDLGLEHPHVISAPGGDVFQTMEWRGEQVRAVVYQETLGSVCSEPDPVTVCGLQGTSMATPHVAGAAAILRGLYPRARRRDVIQALEVSALDLGAPGRDGSFGHGLLQIRDAIDALDALAQTEPFECVADETTLCLEAHGDQWEITMDWSRLDLGGEAQAVDLTATGITQGGAFAFLNPTNPEVLIKVLNGCPLNDRFWVFLAATTDVGFTIRVRQASTGEEVSYFNDELVPAAPVQDTEAFLCP